MADLASLITQEFLALGNDGSDSMFQALAVPCILTYPPIKSACTNCLPDLQSHKSSNIYRAGGPIPFVNTVCPFCGGEGVLSSTSTANVNLQINWNSKTFLQVFREKIELDIGNTFIQTKGLFSDLAKIKKCIEAQMNVKVQGYTKWRFVRSSEDIPCGITQDKYFYMLWKREG